MITEKINIQDNLIRVPKRGDLLSYMYLMRFSKSTGLAAPWDSSIVNSWKLFIGQELIDTQDSVFSLSVAPPVMARNYTRSTIQNGSYFCPLQFWFCNDLPLPLVALQYDEVTIRMDWNPDPGYYYECYFNFVLLAEEERLWFAETAHEISIYQVNKLNSTSDIVLRNPVNFIVSEPIKLPTSYTYGITINGKVLRNEYNSHGAQLTLHTDYSRVLPASSDPYPPLPMTQDTQSLISPYSVGTYSLAVSGNTQTSYALNLHDGDPTTFWNTQGQSGLTQSVTYTASASSNTLKAWIVANNLSNIWISDTKTYTGFDPTISGTYVANSSAWIDNANAYLVFDQNSATAWNSNVIYGNNYKSSFAYAQNVASSSNTGLSQYAEYNAVDGNNSTYWASQPGYYMDALGTYTTNVSSSNTQIQYAYDGNPGTYWESNAFGSYGVTVAQGTYWSNSSSNTAVNSEYYAFDAAIQGTNWTSLQGYGATVNLTSTFTVSASSNLSPGNEWYLVDGNQGTSWSSNSQNSTYGFSTFYGNYASNSSYNLATSYYPFTTSGVSSKAISLGNGVVVNVTGGAPNIYNDVSGYAVLQFTAGANFQIYNSGVAVNILVVGGGGGGGTFGCNGGSGGVVFWPSYSLTNFANYSIGIGYGGGGGSGGQSPAGLNDSGGGGASFFGTLVADGGGAGGMRQLIINHGGGSGGYGGIGSPAGYPDGGSTQGGSDGSTGYPYGFGGTGCFNSSGVNIYGTFYSFPSIFGTAYTSATGGPNVAGYGGGVGAGGIGNSPNIGGTSGTNGIVLIAVPITGVTPIGWSSNTTYGNTFAKGVYSIVASSNLNSNPGWMVADGNDSQSWISNAQGNVYGYALPAGNYGSNASPASNPLQAWQAFAGSGWTSAVSYGNITPVGATYNFTSSQVNGAEWQPFNPTSLGSWSPGVRYYGSNTFTTAPAVASITQSQGTTTTTSIALSFVSVPSATGYVLTSTATSATNVCTSAPFTYQSLTPGTSYYFYVTSWNLAGQGGQQSALLATLPSQVSGLATTSTPTGLNVSWNGVNGGATYTANLYYSNGTLVSSQTGLTGTSTTFSGLRSGLQYYFNVTAYNINNLYGATSANFTCYTTPSAVTNFNEASVTATTVGLTWTVPSGQTVSYYSINAVGADGSNFTQNTSTNSSSYTFTGLNPNVQYTFYITSINAASATGTNSSPSQLSWTTLAGPVTGVSVVLGQSSNTTVNLTWNSPSGGASSYSVSNGTTTITGITGTSYTFTGLTAATSYTFTVAPYNSSNVQNAASAGTATGSTAPGATTLTQGTSNSTSITVNWTAASTATSYTVNNGAGQIITVSGTTATFNNLNPDTNYNFSITTSSAAGTGPTTNATFPTAPSAVSGLGASSTSDVQIVANWNPNTATSYVANIYYFSNNTLVSTQTVSGTTATFNGLVAGTRYVVSVIGRNAAGYGPASTTPEVDTGPVAPTLASYTSTSSSIYITVNPPINPITAFTEFFVNVIGPGYTSVQVGAYYGTPFSFYASNPYYELLNPGKSYTITIQSATYASGTLGGTLSTTYYTAPSAVTNLAIATYYSNGAVQLTWTPNAGQTITSYTIQAAGSDSSNFTKTGIASGSSSYIFTGLNFNVTYTFTVYAVNAGGNGDQAQVSGLTVPAAVTGIQNTVGPAGPNQITLSWTGTASSYTVTSTPGTTTQTTGTNSVTMPSLSAATGYTFTVVPSNSSGNGPSTTSGTINTPKASGGSVYYATVSATNYYIHVFTGGTTTFTLATTTTADVFLVAGGGAGGTPDAGGGGAGGLVMRPAISITAGTYQVNVGNGGSGGPGTNTQSGGQGLDSNLMQGSTGILVAKGGGGGGGGYVLYAQAPPLWGGSGGGSAAQTGGNPAAASGNTSIQTTQGTGSPYGLGFAGGGNGTNGAGGGGGAGAAGSTGTSSVSGAGGAGVYIADGITIGTAFAFGTIGSYGQNVSGNYYFAGGGGGGFVTGGSGGLGGGGTGGSSSDGSSGQNNTGGGGGGGGAYGHKGGNGGSGLVLIRYAA